jgi:transposase-like protein
MGRKPRVDRSPEEKMKTLQEGRKNGKVSETCRRHGIAPNLLYLIARWIEECNYDRPHRGVGNRTQHEAFLAFAVYPKMRSRLSKLAGALYL